MTTRLFCDRCGKQIISTRIKITPDEGVCPQCYEKINRKSIDDIDIPEKPEIVYLWDQKLSLMGNYPDGKERYMITIPKRQRNDFFLDRHYDVKFILKVKEE